jgi:hypothetical protein
LDQDDEVMLHGDDLIEPSLEQVARGIDIRFFGTHRNLRNGPRKEAGIGLA